MTAAHAALAAIGPDGELGNSFVFPYAPETLQRSFEHGAMGVTETITIAFALDAADALEGADPATAQVGLHPALARLRELLAETYLILSWGPSRTLPITPIDATVTELAFDAALNPLRVEVTLRAHVVTVSTDQAVAVLVERAKATASGLARRYTAEPLPPIG